MFVENSVIDLKFIILLRLLLLKEQQSNIKLTITEIFNNLKNV